MLSLSGDLEPMVDSEHFSDVAFEVEGRTLHAHRIVLLCSRASEVFRAMLRHPMREATHGAPIRVEGVAFEVFKALVAYLYTGEAEVPPHLAAPLLLATERYMVYPLQLECAHALVAEADFGPDELWQALGIAASLQLPPPPEQPPELPSPAEVLRDAATRYVCDAAAAARPSLQALVAADEFVAYASDLVPRLHEVGHGCDHRESLGHLGQPRTGRQREAHGARRRPED